MAIVAVVGHCWWRSRPPRLVPFSHTHWEVPFQPPKEVLATESCCYWRSRISMVLLSNTCALGSAHKRCGQAHHRLPPCALQALACLPEASAPRFCSLSLGLLVRMQAATAGLRMSFLSPCNTTDMLCLPAWPLSGIPPATKRKNGQASMVGQIFEGSVVVFGGPQAVSGDRAGGRARVSVRSPSASSQLESGVQTPAAAHHQGEKLPELSFWMLEDPGILTQMHWFGRFAKGPCNGNLIGEAGGTRPAATLKHELWIREWRKNSCCDSFHFWPGTLLPDLDKTTLVRGDEKLLSVLCSHGQGTYAPAPAPPACRGEAAALGMAVTSVG
ncbi:uncharacterized protein LOC119866164 [Canis lupus familiaris]|uniref:uncharacterized protein LOC119866164 n=1 Tax=Canis lupus familiaris TaxID=9615 RepID=UPI0006B3D2F5|nr:uncharacterized protein LOC119866164 [Canis lupus familiaris]XP_038315120.1 uncharacterized protein LOC119866164 [Canis lupus familiaris]XP_038431152.1 uncharacterized protein LOC119866164 [Canis lupus familiaris]XP_038431153.1 uncharacterized protein LOC119866164 [Canis lupus familiaris]